MTLPPVWTDDAAVRGGRTYLRVAFLCDTIPTDLDDSFRQDRTFARADLTDRVWSGAAGRECRIVGQSQRPQCPC